jgi:5-methylcytosine-specific restriction endonuclease McrA
VTKALSLCQEPGCPNPATTRGRCPTHQPARRSSTRAWRKARRTALRRAHGRCERCGNPATIGHHKTHAQHGGPDTPDNIEALCTACHQQEHGWGGTPQ